MANNKYKDLIGQTFGILTALERISSNSRELKVRPLWKCLCQCGGEILTRSYLLLSGQIKSCGCLRIKVCSVPDCIRTYKCKSFCNKHYTEIWDRANPEKVKAKLARWRKRNPDSGPAWYMANPDYNKEYNKINAKKAYRKLVKWRKTYPEIKKERNRKYYKANPAKPRARSAKRHAAKLKAVPPWLTDDHLMQIERFYKDAAILTQKTQIEYAVDHIYPLQGKTSCGLHVPWNLQVVTRSENSAKGNKLPEEFYAK